MAQIETAEGQTLIVENQSSNPRLRFEARLSDDGGMSRGVDETVFSVYSESANPHSDLRPRSRGDLTAEVVEDFANRLVGWAVAEGIAGRREDVIVASLKFYDRDSATRARQPYVPDWEDDWPEDGSASDKVRFMLDCDTAFSDEEIAAGAGCSRSLVNDIKAAREEEGDED